MTRVAPLRVASLPADRAIADASAPCLEDLGRRLTAGEFAVAVERLAGGLAARGVGPGTVVGAMLPNRIELVLWQFACWRLRAALTPVNPALTPDEAGYQLADSAAVLVLVDEDTASKVGDVPAIGVDEVSALDGPVAATAPKSEDLAFVIYTSGTTGRPKGVLLDHGNVSAMTEMLVAALGLTAMDRCLLILPLFHVNGLLASVCAPLAAGGATIVAPRYDPKLFWTWVERFRPSYFSAVPTIYVMLNALPSEVRPDTSSLRLAICGAAPMPVEAIDAFERRYGVPVVEGYGLSEGTVASTLNPVEAPRKPGTVGVALPGQEVRVVDDDGRQLPPGEIGEVVIRGPNVMRGYLNRPQATAAVLREGWLHTGDIGRLDDDGFLTLVDRKKDLIIRGGENIYPKEIEAVLYRDPSVAEAVVIGAPDPVFGEVPVAFVAPAPGARVDPDVLIEQCRRHLARFKVPAAVHIREALPKNPVGKLIKAPLRDEVAEETAGQASAGGQTAPG